MIISHKHRYLFVELPRTGTTAISRELCEKYDGEAILKKHATYEDFLRSPEGENGRDYYTFSCIRHPMDKAVSLYYKYKTDHRSYYSSGRRKGKDNWIVRIQQSSQFKFISSANADFSDYFMRYFWIPYDDWSILSHDIFNRIIRFEALDEGLSKVLGDLNLEQVRPLPRKNITGSRAEDFYQYYPKKTRQRAKWIFGPYMKKWGYSFPPDWDMGDVGLINKLVYKTANAFRSLYWKYYR